MSLAREGGRAYPEVLLEIVPGTAISVYTIVLHGSAGARSDPALCLASDHADGLRASELEPTVQDTDHNGYLARLMPISCVHFGMVGHVLARACALTLSL